MFRIHNATQQAVCLAELTGKLVQEVHFQFTGTCENMFALVVQFAALDLNMSSLRRQARLQDKGCLKFACACVW